MPVASSRCPCTGSLNHSINLRQNPSDMAPGVGKSDEAVTATSGLSRRTDWVPISKTYPFAVFLCKHRLLTRVLTFVKAFG
jgi:hypothetical protein